MGNTACLHITQAHLHHAIALFLAQLCTYLASAQVVMTYDVHSVMLPHNDVIVFGCLPCSVLPIQLASALTPEHTEAERAMVDQEQAIMMAAGEGTTACMHVSTPHTPSLT